MRDNSRDNVDLCIRTTFGCVHSLRKTGQNNTK